MANVLRTDEHESAKVDPFDARPCTCPTVLVHTTDGDTLGDDLVECATCKWRMTLRELYRRARESSD